MNSYRIRMSLGYGAILLRLKNGIHHTWIQLCLCGISSKVMVRVLFKARPREPHYQNQSSVSDSIFYFTLFPLLNIAAFQTTMLSHLTHQGLLTMRMLLVGSYGGFCRPVRCPGAPSRLTSHLSVTPLSSSALILRHGPVSGERSS